MIQLLLPKKFDVHVDLEYLEIARPDEDLVRWLVVADLLQVVFDVDFVNNDALPETGDFDPTVVRNRTYEVIVILIVIVIIDKEQIHALAGQVETFARYIANLTDTLVEALLHAVHAEAHLARFAHILFFTQFLFLNKLAAFYEEHVSDLESMMNEHFKNFVLMVQTNDAIDDDSATARAHGQEFLVRAHLDIAHLFFQFCEWRLLNIELVANVDKAHLRAFLVIVENAYGHE